MTRILWMRSLMSPSLLQMSLQRTWNRSYRQTIVSLALIAFPSTSCADMSIDEAMKTKVLPPIADLEIETEAVSTWSIDDWRALKQKERGPIFECGGQPWYVGRSQRGIQAIETMRGGPANGTTTGEFCFSLTATMLTSPHSILNKEGKRVTRRTSRQKAGTLAYNLPWSCGIRMIPPCTSCIVRPSVDVGIYSELTQIDSGESPVQCRRVRLGLHTVC